MYLFHAVDFHVRIVFHPLMLLSVRGLSTFFDTTMAAITDHTQNCCYEAQHRSAEYGEEEKIVKVRQTRILIYISHMLVCSYKNSITNYK